MSAQGQATIAFYNTHAQEYSDSTIHVDMRDVHERFLDHLPGSAHILDAGSGSGRDTKAFLDRGYRVTSIDGSKAMARLATTFTGQNCLVMRFQEMAFEEEFDGIWACASLLHIPRQDMPDVLRRFAAALKSGGVLYCSLKEGEGERIAEDGRLFNYYSPSAFRQVLSSVPQLHEVEFWRTAERRSHTHLEPWLSFLLQKR